MKLRHLLLTLLSATVLCQAQTATPSDESLKELLDLTGAKKLITDVQDQLKSSVGMSMDSALSGQNLTTIKRPSSRR